MAEARSFLPRRGPLGRTLRSPSGSEVECRAMSTPVSPLQSAALPVLYLPGASGRGRVWQPIASRLERRRPPLVLDYPGFGAMAPATNIGSLEDLAGYVLSAAPQRCDVVSLSMGSAVALRVALLAPERVRRLVLVTAVGGVDAVRLGGLDWRDAFRARRPEAPTWFVDDAVDLSERLTDVSAPTLLVFGERDAIAPPSVAHYFRERLPRARLELIPDATHDLEEEQPDLLASLIEAHLRGV